MITKTPMYQLPCPSTELEGDAGLFGNVLTYQYFRDGVLVRAGIRFKRVAAIRTRAERCCTAWHIEEVYDTLTEVENSPWVTEVKGDTQQQFREKWGMHHFMIYLDSFGCAEIIAESWEKLDEVVVS